MKINKPSIQNIIHNSKIILGVKQNSNQNQNQPASHTNPHPTPPLYPSFNLATKPLASSWAHSCHITRQTRKLSCWGSNEYNQLHPPKLKINAVQVAVGLTHTCAIQSQNDRTHDTSELTHHCWGGDHFGQLHMQYGVVNKIECGRGHTCGLQIVDRQVVEKELEEQDRRVSGDGGGGDGDMGIDEVGLDEKKVEVGKDGDKDWCREDDEYVNKTENIDFGAIFGDSINYSYCSKKTCINMLSNATKKQPKNEDSVLINTSDSNNYIFVLKCFGALRDYYNMFKTADLPIKYTYDVLTFESGSSHLCLTLIHDEFNLHCHGSNRDGESDVPTLNPYANHSFSISSPIPIISNPNTNTAPDSIQASNLLPKFLKYSLGDRHTCAVIQDGQLLCWGNNNSGQSDQLSNNNIKGFRRPFIVEVQAGAQHNAAHNSVGMQVFWGNNQFGQTRNVANKLQRQLLVNLGGQHNCLLTESDKVVCWGSNKFGQCTVKGT